MIILFLLEWHKLLKKIERQVFSNVDVVIALTLREWINTCF